MAATEQQPPQADPVTTMRDTKDALFSEPLGKVPKFRFDQHVVDVFPDMIARSVPGYETILHIIGQLVERYAQDHSHCYDLGCSLGAALLAMRHGAHTNSGTKQIKLVGVDNSAAMIQRCRKLVDADTATVPVELIEADVLTVPLRPMSVCIVNFTLQFIDIDQRTRLLSRIADAMLPGGILLLSEKLAFPDSQHNQLMSDLHHDFKRANGYSELEIAQKRQAIEDVLIPESFDTHKQRLLNAGFRSAELWFQCFNFSSILAFK